MRGCGRCHTCGTKLNECLDGEEWCSKCQSYRRYASHGWSLAYGELTACDTARTREGKNIKGKEEK